MILPGRPTPFATAQPGSSTRSASQLSKIYRGRRKRAGGARSQHRRNSFGAIHQGNAIELEQRAIMAAGGLALGNRSPSNTRLQDRGPATKSRSSTSALPRREKRLTTGMSHWRLRGNRLGCGGIRCPWRHTVARWPESREVSKSRAYARRLIQPRRLSRQPFAR